jgi:hypothetical protein
MLFNRIVQSEKGADTVCKNMFSLVLSILLSLSLRANAKENSPKTTSETPYVIGSLIGQLGNQLFEVATTSALAWDHGAEAYFPGFGPSANRPDGGYQHIFFRVKINPPSQEISSEWTAPPFGYFPIQYQPKMKLSGYFQCEKYFSHYRDRLLKLFAPAPTDLLYIQTKYRWIIDHPNSVSVHLRYYYAEMPDNPVFVQYDREYYKKAMNLFPKNSLFVVTSDNMNFARQNIPVKGRNVVFIENEPFYIDFFLQSLCKNNIIGNSTFSWWSAWLNKNPNKIVVRPKLWLKGFPDIGAPDEWIKIKAHSMQDKMQKHQ